MLFIFCYASLTLPVVSLFYTFSMHFPWRNMALHCLTALCYQDSGKHNRNSPQRSPRKLFCTLISVLTWGLITVKTDCMFLSALWVPQIDMFHMNYNDKNSHRSALAKDSHTELSGYSIIHSMGTLEAQIFINAALMPLCTMLSTASVYASGYWPCH